MKINRRLRVIYPVVLIFLLIVLSVGVSEYSHALIVFSSFCYAIISTNIVCLPMIAINEAGNTLHPNIHKRIGFIMLAHSFLCVLCYFSSIALFLDHTLSISSSKLILIYMISSVLTIIIPFSFTFRKCNHEYHYFNHPETWGFVIKAPWYIYRNKKGGFKL